jgi:membrane protease YdiL (CAAX protease family)
MDLPIDKTGIIVIAWAVALLVSDLPDAIWHRITGGVPKWLIWGKIGILLILIGFGWILEQLASLRSFFILLLILIPGLKIIKWLMLRASSAQTSAQGVWLLRMVSAAGIGLLLVTILVAALFLLGKQRQDFFLAMGDLGKWKVPGIILAVVIMTGTYFFFNYKLPSKDILIKALPLLPLALLFAALLAFNEEMMFRATLLSPLYEVVGKGHAILISAVVFGMAHYFRGTPSGIEGAIVAGALGWLWATITLETKGVYMSWFIHFLNNIPTLIFWAIGSVS